MKKDVWEYVILAVSAVGGGTAIKLIDVYVTRRRLKSETDEKKISVVEGGIDSLIRMTTQLEETHSNLLQAREEISKLRIANEHLEQKIKEIGDTRREMGDPGSGSEPNKQES